MHVFENKVKISNGRILKMLPTSLPSVNMSVIATGDTPVVAELCFGV